MELRNKSRRSTGKYSSGYNTTGRRQLSELEKAMLARVAREKMKKARERLAYLKSEEGREKAAAEKKRKQQIAKKKEKLQQKRRKYFRQKHLEEVKRKREAENNRLKKQKIATFEKMKTTLQTRLKNLKKISKKKEISKTRG